MSIFLSEADLRRIFPHANEAVMTSVAAEWNETLGKYGINANQNRLLFFLAETSAETGGWSAMVEGGEFTGDRGTFKGRGLIQLTGRANYQEIGAKLAHDFPDAGLVSDLANNPDLVSEPKYVLKTSAAYWDVNKLNSICDTGDFLLLSNRINGSKTFPNGWAQRQSELARIRKLLLSLTDTANAPLDSGPQNNVLKIGDSGPLVSALQTMLQKAGYDVGDIDGKFGTLTRMALLAFQADHGLVPTGLADAVTNAALNQPGERPLADSRVSATIGDLIQLGSRTATNGRNANIMGLFAAIFGALGITNSAVTGVANTAKSAGAAAQTTATASTTDTIGPTIKQLQDIVNAAPLNAPTLAPPLANLKTQLQAIINGLDAHVGTLKTLDVPTALKSLHQFLAQTPLPPETVRAADGLVTQLQNQLAAVPETLGPAAHSTLNTVFDLLPPDALGAVTPVLTTVANSVFPGFGGALVTLGIGVATQVFGNRVLAARLDDHKTASNINL